MNETYKYADYVRELVDSFPPLTTEQRAKLAILLRPTAKTSEEASDAAA